MTQTGVCRICGGQTTALLDLGRTPLANALMERRDQHMEEFPLLMESCECGNFQLRFCLDAGVLYTNYNYATPQSPSLTAHYQRLLDHLQNGRFLSGESAVVEIGSNNGLFLEFLAPHVRSVLGVDPARNIAEMATARGIPTVADFFNADVARRLRAEHGAADLIVGRHCMAHNKEPYPILDGVLELLAPDGTLVIENAYAMKTFENNEFDQVYHEHMFYFTLHALRTMLEKRGLTLCDVLTSEIHGGSIAAIAKRSSANPQISRNATEELRREDELLSGGLAQRFAANAETIQNDLRRIVSDLVRDGEVIYAYGATAKGATLLNSTGLSSNEIPYCADSTPMKQGRFIPKSGVQIVSEEWAFANPPDYFLLTAWNYKDELIAKVKAAGLSGVRFIVPVPNVYIV